MLAEKNLSFEGTDVLKNKKGVSRFLYFLLFQYFHQKGRFFNHVEDISKDLLLSAELAMGQSFSFQEIEQALSHTRQINRYKEEIRRHFGFRRFNAHVLDPLKRRDPTTFLNAPPSDSLKESICDFLKEHRTEIPDEQTLQAVLQDLTTFHEEKLFQKIYQRLSLDHRTWIDDTLLSSSEEETVCHFLRQDSGPSVLESIQEELHRLRLVRHLPLETMAFAKGLHPRRRSLYKRRFLSDTPLRTKRRHPIQRYALATLFCLDRSQTITDNCVDHFLNIVHSLQKRFEAAERRFMQNLREKIKDIHLLYTIAEINRDHPKEIIEEAVYSVVPQEQIDALIKAKQTTQTIKAHSKESLLRRYTRTARTLLFGILDHLDVCSSNETFLKALSFIKTYQTCRSAFYPKRVTVPLKGILSTQEQAFVCQKDIKGNIRVLRKAYEYVIHRHLRKKLRNKEAWVKGALKYRDPTEDLPKDFEENRSFYYHTLHLPLDAPSFVHTLQESMTTHLTTLNQDLPKNPQVTLITKKGKPWIKVSPVEKRPDPSNIERLKHHVLTKWGVLDLLDILKEVDCRENLMEGFSTAGNREILSRESIRMRLLLCLFALGTNTGLKRISGASLGAVTFEELRHIKRFFINKEDLRDVIARVANAIFHIREPKIWGYGTTACGSDSTQFGAYDQNLMTEWHPRYQGSGIMIYWHVNTQSICIYSQLKSCTSSEVASMLQGLLDHHTEMDIQTHSTDTHGKSDLGFALTYLLGFDLRPRYKSLGSQKLFKPTDDFHAPHLSSILDRSIDWDLIAARYDDMVQHVAALRMGISQADTLIRKFSKSNYGHPTFKAFMELGRAVRTCFLCRYLTSLELRQQIHASLNVVENWHSANLFIYYGKSGEMASNSREEQELSMLCLHLLQLCLVYMNTLLIQEIFLEQKLLAVFQPEDFRALTSLFYHHINPYGVFILDFTKRLSLRQERFLR